MILAIDQGNTNTVFALLEGETLQRKWRIASDENRTADEYMVWISALMNLAGIGPDQVEGAVLASVVPQGQLSLVLLCRRYFECEPLIVGEPELDLGIEARIRDPRDVGADRLVNAVAAREQFGAPLIIVDFGTATTFDVIGREGDYMGGVISPGVNLSLKALHEAAAKLPRIAVEAPSHTRVTGFSTLEAMHSGVFWGYVSLIDGIVSRLKREHDGEMRVIATGGLAKVFTGHCAGIDEIDHDLTVTGLRLIYERNLAQRRPVRAEEG